MADRTGIEWTDTTWNPVTGCTKVSAGCKNCYAETFAGRGIGSFAGGRKFTDVRTHEDRLDAPLRWRKPRRVFVNSMSDLFHDAVSDLFIARVFTVMALAPKHTFQILTKRPERMRAWFEMQGRTPAAFFEEARKGGDWMAVPMPGAVTWPLPNVWLGVSVEDQRAADERIPLLLKTPAAVRFLSCEPMLGPLDLAGWGAASSSSEFAFEQPPGWDGYPWPDWVPADQRAQIEKFWNVRDGRGPRGWIDNQRVNRMPASGARVGARMRRGWAEVVPALSSEASKHGRWLHSWNNVGRVVTDDGETLYASAGAGPGWLSKWSQGDGQCRHRLHWVIAGGESGPGARPCDVAWIRSLLEQCKTAGVACFVKQLGAAPFVGDGKHAHVAGQRGYGVVCDEGDPCPHCGRHPITHWPTLNLRDRKGGDPAEWPEDLRVREFPEVHS